MLKSAIILAATAVVLRYVDWDGRPLIRSWRAAVVFVLAGLAAGRLLTAVTGW